MILLKWILINKEAGWLVTKSRLLPEPINDSVSTFAA